MIWIICFLLSAVIALVSIRLALRKGLGGTRLLFIMLGCLAIAYILYIPPFFDQYGFTAALLGCFLNVMQVISLDADYLLFYELICERLGSGAFASLYFAFLAAIHFLLPVVSAMTAVTLVVRWLSQIRVDLIKRRRRPLYVFSQINDRSVLLARDICRHEKKCSLLFVDDRDGTEQTELRRELHCVILKDKMENLRMDTRRRQVHYYCISDDQEENLTAALSILELLKDQDRTVQQKHHIFLFSSDPMAELLIDSVQKGFVDVSLVDEARCAAYGLLEQYPLPHYARESRIRILICGFSPMGDAFLRAAAWCGQLTGYSLSCCVIGRDIDQQALDFQARYPGLFSGRYAIQFLSYQNELEFQQLLARHAPDANYIVVACGSEEQTIEKAVYLRRFFYQVDPQFQNAPPVFAHIGHGEKAQAVAALSTAEANPQRRMPYQIIPFGMAEQLYTYQSLTDSQLELLSKNVHLVYEDIFSESGVDVVSALERYNLFEVNKSSNRANALHIRYKLAMLGLDYTDAPDAVEVSFTDYLTDEALERLTVAEHDRWMAFLESEGWTQATLEQAQAYQRSGISRGRHNCPLLKMHPYICPFGELKTCSDRLGLPDSTVYDRELISRIPDILHDKWNLSGRRYKIIQIQSGLGG